MFTSLFKLIDIPEPENETIGVELATAALLMEIVHADYKREGNEIEAAERALRSTFSLPVEQMKRVLNKAEELHSDAVSIHPFITAINDGFSNESKYQLIINLWRVALADGELDKFEQHYIRKIAELLYVPHSEFIRAKLKVCGEQDEKPA
ncbi:MAG: TerB family tellurite resistance protein [Pseudomonadales bacterium]